jgi:DNA polymerase-3 subunit epsilon
MGLGRSIYSVLSEMTLRQAQAQLADRLVHGESEPSLHLELPGVVSEAIYPVQLAPICSLEPEGQDAPAITGYVLTFQRQGASTPQTPGRVDASVPAPARKAPRPGWHHRPEFYDFDLFQNRDDAMESEVWRHKPLDSLSFTVFDTETTGLNPLADQIIQIGAVRIWNRRLLTEEIFEQLVDPERPIPKESTAIHGIQDAQVKGQPRIDPVLQEFHAFCGETVLIAHNAAFDMRFLQLREPSSGVRFVQPVLDTLLLSACVHPEHDDHSLEAIANRLGVVCAARHDAVQDAFITAQVFLKLLPLLMQEGIQTLEQALEASKKTRYARVRY